MAGRTTHMKRYLLILLLGTTAATYGAQRSSTDYSIIADSLDAGGATVTSTNYSINESMNDSGGSSSEVTSGYLAKSSYIGQLFDVVGVIPTAPIATVNEGGTMQLGVAQVLDDASYLPITPSLAAWNVVSGSISGIDSNGLATAAIVYQDTTSTVGATYNGFYGTLNLTVLNVNNDDYGPYAGDGLPDDWQIQYFGANNPKAGPNVDADGTGQTNLFKYIAGLNPIDPSSRFTFTIQPVPGQPGQKNVIFTPIVAGRSYTVVSKARITDATWAALNTSSQSDNGAQRTVTDLSATGTTKFYEVQISKP